MQPKSISFFRSFWAALLVCLIAAGLIGASPVPGSVIAQSQSIQDQNLTPGDHPRTWAGYAKSNFLPATKEDNSPTSITAASQGAPLALMSSTDVYLPLILNGAVFPSVYSEGFESGVFQSGWTVVTQSPTDIWEVVEENPHTDNFSARVHVDESQLADLHTEVLISPVFTGKNASVEMYSGGSLFWCRVTHNNCDLKVWLVKGAWGGGDDVMLKLLDDDWVGPSDFNYAKTTIDLTSHLSTGESWRIAWEYTGSGETGEVYLDDILVTYAP